MVEREYLEATLIRSLWGPLPNRGREAGWYQKDGHSGSKCAEKHSKQETSCRAAWPTTGGNKHQDPDKHAHSPRCGSLLSDAFPVALIQVTLGQRSMKGLRHLPCSHPAGFLELLMVPKLLPGVWLLKSGISSKHQELAQPPPPPTHLHQKIKTADYTAVTGLDKLRSQLRVLGIKVTQKSKI